MIAPLLLALATTHAKLGPAFPPLTSSEFQNAVRSVEENLEKGDFATAGKQADLLPKHEVSLVWDDRKVPVSQRTAFRAAMQQAVQAWRMVRVTLKPAGGDIRISFEQRLANDNESGAPSNVVSFFSDAAGEPRLSSVIGLQRGGSARPATERDIANDVRYAIGSYLGLTRHSLPAYTMFGASATDEPRVIGAPETRSAIAAMRLAGVLRNAVATKTSVGLSGVPEAKVTPSGFEGTALQGDQVDLPIEVTNTGTGTINVDAEGDCGCIVPEHAVPVEPGKTGSVGLRLETQQYAGLIERKIYVFTNDPKLPVVTVPVKVNISPRYRFIIPQGATFTVDDGVAKKLDVYLTFPDGQDMEVTRVRASGIDGATATLAPWKGTLADPEMNDPAKERHGYHISVTIPASLRAGRSLLSLAFITKDPEFGIFYASLYAQRGILASPTELFLGEIGDKPKTATILVTRPGRPFEVKSVKTSATYLTVKVEPGEQAGDIKIVLTYNGKAPAGDLVESVTIETNDPKQPKITVPVTGSVR